MSAFEIIWLELNDSRATGSQEIVQVRVTTDAIIGSPVTTMLTPERARMFRLRAYQGGGVDADLAGTDRLREILVHPADWVELLREVDRVHAFRPAMRPGDVDRVFGIPVVR